jgi:hypothetical protein
MTRSRRALEAFVSGCMVYALMAACSSKGMIGEGTGTTSGHGSTGSGGHGGTGGMTHASSAGSGGAMGNGGTMGSGGDSGIMDALTDPVSEAMAGIENPQSGTRLKGKYTMGSDGSKQYQLAVNVYDVIDYLPFNNGTYIGRGVQPVWYDSMLMTDCTFTTAADGTLRCLPGVALTPGAAYNVVFSDDQCSQPLMPMEATSFGCPTFPVPVYVTLYEEQPPAACAQTTPKTLPIHVFKVGAMTSAPAQAYTISNGPTLACNSINLSQSVVWYTATEVPASSFVQGTTGIDP